MIHSDKTVGDVFSEINFEKCNKSQLFQQASLSQKQTLAESDETYSFDHFLRIYLYS